MGERRGFSFDPVLNPDVCEEGQRGRKAGVDDKYERVEVLLESTAAERVGVGDEAERTRERRKKVEGEKVRARTGVVFKPLVVLR